MKGESTAARPRWVEETTAAAIRRRIALYREYLRNGVDADLARRYLNDIAVADAPLAEIERREAGKAG